MALPIHTQSKIAMIWDFDRTLIPRYSQEPLFRAYGVDEAVFWRETNALPGIYRDRGMTVGEDTAYLIHMLSYVRAGVFHGLTNERLRVLGGEIECCPGMPDFLTAARDMVLNDSRYAKHEIELEHYVVSTGIRQLIEGSAVGPHMTRIWASEFIDQPPAPGFDVGSAAGPPGVIEQVGFMMDNTSKTRAVFEINKGSEVPVNARVAEEDRRIPFQNMIYIADGPSDVPVFSLVMKNGGRNLGVYQPHGRSNFLGVKQLEDEGRVHSTAPADFTVGTQAYLWLTTTLRQIADAICERRERRFAAIKAPAGHVT